MKKLIIDVLRQFCRYAVIVIGGTCLFLIIVQIVGYLPYSDRPGPGWYGLFPKITLAEFTDSLIFVGSWGLLVLIYSPFAFIPLFVIVRLLEWSGIPRFINAVVGGLLGGLVSTYFILGMGWYIALAGAPLIVAGLLGVLYGGWILPVRDLRIVAGRRISYPRLCTALGVSIVIIYLLFPDVFHSAIFGRKDSYTIEGVITKDQVPQVGLKVGDFSDADSCTGNFTETVTNASGAFTFQRGYKSDEFPQRGPCAYRVTLCYLDNDRWHKFWSGGHSGPCGGRATDKLQYNLSRPGDYKMKSKF